MNIKKIIIIITIIVLSLIILLQWFYLFNQNYFIKKDFTKAFNYRITWNCSNFKNYTYNGSNLDNNCIDEKNRKSTPIKSFNILNISTTNWIAYLQVELVRKLDKESSYVITYEMEKIDKNWKIKSDNKN